MNNFNCKDTYRAAYKCELCGEKLLSTKFVVIPKDKVSGAISKILIDGKMGKVSEDFPTSFATHDSCKYGCGVAKFAGFVEVK